ncbi:START domain containing protein, putative [Trypanosoma equiperdum]|uniref:START domain containing protein, putative n=1 Tax=Trypanosoma equiperdum TaxID=5694 RepID=A0A1G4IEN7_TRYEQ|nr:START domain containing protein, putative [Trypanosoma equiperdum]
MPSDTTKEEEETVVYKTPFPLTGEEVSNAGRKYRLPAKNDFLAFRNYADSLEGYSLRCNRPNDTIVWSKKVKGESLNVVKVFSVYPGVDPQTMYDMLQDGLYRVVWDTYRIEAFCIVQLSPNTDIGYYAAKSPATGVTNRDFVNQRAWHSAGNGEFIIFNTSVPHRDVPTNYLKANKISSDSVVRGFSKITGYLIRPWEDKGTKGCCLTYVTQCDVGGWIPTMVMNYVTTKASPNTVKTVRGAVAGFTEWVPKQSDYQRTWTSDPDPFDVPSLENITIQFAKEKWAGESGSS